MTRTSCAASIIRKPYASSPRQPAPAGCWYSTIRSAVASRAASIAHRPGLAALNDMVTGQAAVIAVIDQFEILVFAMLIVSPLVLFLRKPRPAN